MLASTKSLHIQANIAHRNKNRRTLKGYEVSKHTGRRTKKQSGAGLLLAIRLHQDYWQCGF